MVVDPDPELAKVLAAELAEATGHPVSSAACTCIIATQCHATEVAAATGNTPLRIIQLRSMQDVLKGQQRPPFPVLIAIVSRSKSILAWASTLLSALGFDPENVVLRNPGNRGWSEGLSACARIAADLAASKELPAQFRHTVFRIVAKESLVEISGLVTV